MEFTDWTDDVLQDAPYRALYVDPPWNYNVLSATAKQRKKERPKGPWSGMDAPFESMTQQEICDLPLELILDPESCLLFLWSPWSRLKDALAVMEAWGFRYSSGFPWVKVTSKGNISWNPGFWFNVASETLLIGVKGHTGRPNPACGPATKIIHSGLAVGESPDMAVKAPRGQHAAKPILVSDWIKDNFAGPRLELFARGKREGWSVWGFEAGE